MSNPKDPARIQDGETLYTLSVPRADADHLLLRMTNRQTVSAGGIDVSSAALEPLPYGKVFDVGPDCTDKYKKGDHVIVPSYAGAVIPLDEDKNAIWRFVRERDIMGHWEEVVEQDAK